MSIVRWNPKGSMWWHVLCRRSQKRGVTWERMIAIAKCGFLLHACSTLIPRNASPPIIRDKSRMR